MAYVAELSEPIGHAPKEITINTPEGPLRLTVRPLAYPSHMAAKGTDREPGYSRMIDLIRQVRFHKDPKGAAAQCVFDVVEAWECTSDGNPIPLTLESLKEQDFNLLVFIIVNVEPHLILDDLFDRNSQWFGTFIDELIKARAVEKLKATAHLPHTDVRQLNARCYAQSLGITGDEKPFPSRAERLEMKAQNEK